MLSFHTQLLATHDPKAVAILQAGYECFLSAGLRRTSMQDIAARVGISRAALYLHFRNKSDIYGALIQAHQAVRLKAVEDALGSHDDPGYALTTALDAQIDEVEEAFLRSPHAQELLPDVLSNEATVRTYAHWIDVGVQSGRLSAEAVHGNSERTAKVMLLGLAGLRGLASDWPAYTDAHRHLARVYARALTA